MKLSIANNTNQYNNEDNYFGIIGEQSNKWGYINPDGSWQAAPPESPKSKCAIF